MKLTVSSLCSWNCRKVSTSTNEHTCYLLHKRGGFCDNATVFVFNPNEDAPLSTFDAVEYPLISFSMCCNYNSLHNLLQNMYAIKMKHCLLLKK